MFVESTSQVGITQRVVATLVACAVVLFTIGVYNTVQAANLTDISNTLSDSDPSVTSSHTIAFTIPTGSTLANTDTITITFDTEGAQDFSDINTTVVGNVSVTVNGVADAATGFASDGDTISFAGIDATQGQEVIVTVADGVISNPATPGSYEILVDTGNGDTGRTRVAIIDNVLVTAIVATTFDFVITGLATTSAVNGETTTGSTTATAIPFGNLAADTAEVLAQQLNVTTNAANGFVVTVEQDADLQSSTGAIIDSFTDGTYVDTPTAWAVPTDDIGDETTWGHWGLTTSDGNLQGAGVAFTAVDQFVAASTTPRAIFAHDGPADGTTTGGTDATTDDVGQALVGYKIEITPLQEAGDDYSTTLTYIATPTF